MLARIDVEPACLPFLMDILAGNRAVASWLLRQPAALDHLMDDLIELDSIDPAANDGGTILLPGGELPGYARRAIETLRRGLAEVTRGDQAARLCSTTMREQLLRIAYVQFVRGGRPSDVRMAFAKLHDEIVDEALRWAASVVDRRGAAVVRKTSRCPRCWASARSATGPPAIAGPGNMCSFSMPWIATIRRKWRPPGDWRRC